MEGLIGTYGYMALLVGTFLEGETILVLGGIAAKLGYMDITKVIIIAFIGSFTGDQMYFFIGRFKGRDLIAKHPKWVKRVDRVHDLFEGYHNLIMLGFRFVYGMRIITPFTIGMGDQIKLSRFAVFNALGAIIWAVVIGGAGYIFGHMLEGLIKDIKRYELAIIGGVLAIGLILFFIHKIVCRIRGDE